MRITNRDRLNLVRFGCALPAKQNAIYVRWDKERLNQAPSANIVVRLAYAQCTSGPLLFLALEISPTKDRPHYCFFPFDLTNSRHRNYLCTVLDKRNICLCFLADSRRVTRTCELLPNQCARFSTAVTDLDKSPVANYDYDRVVSEFEQQVRLVDCFEYVLSDTELQRVIASSRLEAAKVSPEDRAHAAKVTNDLLGVFRSRPEGFVRERLNQLSRVRRGLLFLSDLHRQFGARFGGPFPFSLPPD